MTSYGQGSVENPIRLGPPPRSWAKTAMQVRSRFRAEPVPQVQLSRGELRLCHMAASLLLEYPDSSWRERRAEIEEAVQQLPEPMRRKFEDFLTSTQDQRQLEAHYVETFDMKRKYCLYLSYYLAGDTRRRGVALVAFREAYRAAGWEFDAAELPDYLPAFLELAAAEGSELVLELLGSHRAGLEVLRSALQEAASPYALLIDAVCMSLPEIDEATREHYLALVNNGPPTELVGLEISAEDLEGLEGKVTS